MDEGSEASLSHNDPNSRENSAVTEDGKKERVGLYVRNTSAMSGRASGS